MATASTVPAPVGGLLGAARAASRPSRLASGLGLLTLIVGFAAYAFFTGLVLYNPTQSRFDALLLGNLTLVAIFGALVVLQLVRLWRERRSGRAGAKLHMRLVAMLSLIAIVPLIFVASVAAVTLNLGIESWFSTRVQAALDNAVGVAHQYAIETGRGITIDAGEMADGIEHDRTLYDESNHVKVGLMIEKLAIMTNDRGLVASFLVDSHGNELASSAKLKYTAALKPSAADIADAKAGRIVVDADPETGIVHALINLPQLNDAYLLAVRAVDPKVFGYYHRTKRRRGRIPAPRGKPFRGPAQSRHPLCESFRWSSCWRQSGWASDSRTGWRGPSPG